MKRKCPDHRPYLVYNDYKNVLLIVSLKMETKEIGVLSHEASQVWLTSSPFK